MLDTERIRSRLASLTYYEENLKRLLPRTEAAYKKSSPETKAAAERYLQVISEIELDVVMLLYKGFELKPAGGEDSIIEATKDKLGSRLTDKVRQRRLLRNSLVHAYANIDDDEVFDLASDLSDVAEFERKIKGFIK